MILSFDRVTKRYRRRSHEITALADASFDVAEGEFWTILASPRSGKTTLLRLAAGMLRPDQGSVIFRGRDTSAMSRRETEQMLRHEIGCAIPGPGVQVEREVLDFIAWPLWSAGVTVREAAARARDMLRHVEASESAGAQVSELSTSELTRVLLAQALVRRPSLLLADEPVRTLDPVESAEVLAILQAARADGVAVVMTTGDASEVRGTHVASLDRGELLVEPRGTADVLELDRHRPGRST